LQQQKLEPKAFKNAWLSQMLISTVSGGIFSAMIMGGILGSTAPFWVNPYPITPLSTKSA